MCLLHSQSVCLRLISLGSVDGELYVREINYATLSMDMKVLLTQRVSSLNTNFTNVGGMILRGMLAAFLTVYSIQLPVRAEKTRDVLSLYGNEVADDAAEKRQELLSAQEVYEDLSKEVAYLNRYNANVQSVDMDSINYAKAAKAAEIYEVQNKLMSGIDLDVGEILSLESQLNTLRTQYDIISEEVIYYNSLYTYKIPVDKVSAALSEVEEKSVEYSAAVQYGEIGDVYNVQIPLDGSYYISSYFGSRIDPLGSGAVDNHRGLDLAASAGTPILALFSGTVTVADTHYGLGNYVRISHGDGIVSTYLHMTDIYVEEGQKVSQYDVIGTVGSTGIWSTGSHLHLALSIDGVYVDPYTLFKEEKYE